MYTQFLSSAPLFQYQYDIVTSSEYFLLLTALHVYTYFCTGVLEKEEENIIIFCNKQIFHIFCQNTTQVQTGHHGIINTQNSGLLTLLTGLLVWCCLLILIIVIPTLGLAQSCLSPPTQELLLTFALHAVNSMHASYLFPHAN